MTNKVPDHLPVPQCKTSVSAQPLAPPLTTQTQKKESGDVQKVLQRHSIGSPQSSSSSPLTGIKAEQLTSKGKTEKFSFKAKWEKVSPKLKEFATTYLKGLNPFSALTDFKFMKEQYGKIKTKLREKFRTKSTEAKKDVKNTSLKPETKTTKTSDSRTSINLDKPSLRSTAPPTSLSKTTQTIAQKRLSTPPSSLSSTTSKVSTIIETKETPIPHPKPTLQFEMVEKDESEQGGFKPASTEKLISFLVKYDSATMKEKEGIDPGYHKLFQVVSNQFKQLDSPQDFLKQYVQKRLDEKGDPVTVFKDALSLAARGGMSRTEFQGAIKEFGPFNQLKFISSEEKQVIKNKLELLDRKVVRSIAENKEAIQLDNKNFLKGNIKEIADDLDKIYGSFHSNIIKNEGVQFDVKKQKESHKEYFAFNDNMMVAFLSNIVQQPSLKDSLNAIQDSVKLTQELMKRGNWEGYLQVGAMLINVSIDKIINSFSKQEVSGLKEEIAQITKNINLNYNYKALRGLMAEKSFIPPLALALKDKTNIDEKSTYESIKNENGKEEKRISLSKLHLSNNVDSSEKEGVLSFEKKYADSFSKGESSSKEQIKPSTTLNQIINAVAIKDNEEKESKLKDIDKQIDNNLPREYRQNLPFIDGVINDQKLIVSDGKLKLEDRRSSWLGLGVGTSPESIEGAMKFFSQISGLKAKVPPYAQKDFLTQLERLEEKSLSKDTWIGNVIQNKNVKEEYDKLIQWKNQEREKDINFFKELVGKLPEGNHKLSVNENGTFTVKARKSGEGKDVGKNSIKAASALLNKLGQLSTENAKENLQLLGALEVTSWFAQVLLQSKEVVTQFENLRDKLQNRG